MIALDTLVGIVQAHPFLFLFPLAVVEGPIVTVIAAWLLRGSPWDLAAAFAICVLADLVGDAGLSRIHRSTTASKSVRSRSLSRNRVVSHVVL